MQKRLLLLSLFFSSSSFNLLAQKNYAQYVNPMIGTGGHGHTYPGAVVPHGMVQLSPDTRLDGWDGCGGYHFSDDYIFGFTHTHLSGTGCSDYGDILLMPMVELPSADNKRYGSKFSHRNEKATAGYYSVKLNDGNILAELTATERVGFHRYSFTENPDASIILDLKHRDEVLESSIAIEDKYTISGLRRSKAWAEDQYVYFVIKFSEPITKSGIWKDEQLLPAETTVVNQSKNLKAFFSFSPKAGKPILAKVALSAVSLAGAKKNLQQEIPGWDFNKIKLDAETKWNHELSRIEVKSNQPNQLRTFYTALYHTMVVPNINMDVDGQYRGRDNTIHTAKGFTNYSVFSLWDTYRACHPLYTIIDQKRTLDYINSFLTQYKEGGRLPVWELASCETDCMIGYHSVPVIVDAYAKGIRNFDTKLALEAMKKSATWNHLGLPAYMQKGMLEVDDEHESVSKALEYAYDDWCIAQFASYTNNKVDYANYIRRAQSYKNMLDPATGFMRPRKNGNWLQPFDAREVNNNYTEANSWQYSFYMPQDISGYINLIGGTKKLENKLDGLFSAPQQTTGRDQSDITGLIGQYAHGNEPSHHIAYLYNFAGAPDKTQEKIHFILNNFYHDAPDGLIGNEDCGQMSAWYVLSAMGFYPVTPGTTDYMIGSPIFKEVKINLENGKSFIIKANNVSDQNFYVQSASLNGKSFDHAYFSHNDIIRGGVMDFTMGAKVSSFGKTNLPSTMINDELIVLNPVIDAGEPAFKKPKTVRMYSNQPGIDYYYTTDGTVPTISSKKYMQEFNIDTSTIINAIAINKKGQTSNITTARLIKSPNNWTLKLNSKYEPQYSAGAEDALINGLTGSANWRTGNWQGFQKIDLDAVIDLLEIKNIHSVRTNFLQDSRSWIIMPKQVIIEVSNDGTNFKQVYSVEPNLPANDMTVQVKTINASFDQQPARFVRLRAIQFGKMPAWHEGAGGDTHIFCDEIVVE